MKVSIFFKAAPLAAFLLACGQPAATNEHAEHAGHEEPAVAINTDTATILDGQEVYFVNLKNGDRVKSPVTVKFGVRGMVVQTTDSGVNAQRGHHHLLIDTLGHVKAGEMVPMGVSSIKHFGKGQKETTLDLPPGKHTLSLQFADGVHRSYGVRMSKSVNITVE